jgi:hypothetical protein
MISTSGNETLKKQCRLKLKFLIRLGGFNFLSIMKSLVVLLQPCDTNVPMLGDIYEGILHMLEII